MFSQSFARCWTRRIRQHLLSILTSMESHSSGSWSWKPCGRSSTLATVPRMRYRRYLTHNMSPLLSIWIESSIKIIWMILLPVTSWTKRPPSTSRCASKSSGSSAIAFLLHIRLGASSSQSCMCSRAWWAACCRKTVTSTHQHNISCVRQLRGAHTCWRGNTRPQDRRKRSRYWHMPSSGSYVSSQWPWYNSFVLRKSTEVPR